MSCPSPRWSTGFSLKAWSRPTCTRKAVLPTPARDRRTCVGSAGGGARPRVGGAQAIVADSLLMKQQLLIVNRSRKRAPNLTVTDRILLGFWSLFLSSHRIRRAAVILRPSTLLNFHDILKKRKYRLLYTARRKRKPGPKGRGVKILMQLPDGSISTVHLSVLYNRLIRQHDSFLSSRLETTVRCLYLDGSVRHDNGQYTHGAHVLTMLP